MSFQRLDEDFVVFRGPPDETPDGALKGSVVLMTGEPMQIKGGIRIKFEGRRRTQYAAASSRNAIMPADNCAADITFNEMKFKTAIMQAPSS